MTKILFVYLGNICHSSMSKFIFIDMPKENGIEHDYIVDFTATSCEDVGNDQEK